MEETLVVNDLFGRLRLVVVAGHVRGGLDADFSALVGAESFPCLRVLDANLDQEGDRFAGAIRMFYRVVASGNHDASACLCQSVPLQLATLGHLPDPLHQLWWHGLAATAKGFDGFELL